MLLTTREVDGDAVQRQPRGGWRAQSGGNAGTLCVRERTARRLGDARTTSAAYRRAAHPQAPQWRGSGHAGAAEGIARPCEGGQDGPRHRAQVRRLCSSGGRR
jgi:hypothetical protein